MESTPNAVPNGLVFDDAKVWYKSRTMIGSIVAVVALVINASGFNVDAALQSTIADTAVDVGGIIGAVTALYGRILATKVLAVR
jgi:hypothetical protein